MNWPRDDSLLDFAGGLAATHCDLAWSPTVQPTGFDLQTLSVRGHRIVESRP